MKLTTAIAMTGMAAALLTAPALAQDVRPTDVKQDRKDIRQDRRDLRGEPGRKAGEPAGNIGDARRPRERRSWLRPCVGAAPRPAPIDHATPSRVPHLNATKGYTNARAPARPEMRGACG